LKGGKSVLVRSDAPAQARHRSRAGWLFILPWLIGFVFLFSRPLVSSAVYAFHTVGFETTGIELEPVGFGNFVYAFTEDANYVRNLTRSLAGMLYEVPIIVFFSMFVALMLNQRFIGRTFVRAVFFLPVIVASGIVISILNGDVLAEALLSGDRASGLVRFTRVQFLLQQLGLSAEIVEYMRTIADNIFELSWRSGMQILLFLAGLQTVSPDLYEVAVVAGASGWETFWKVTFPLISPITLVNTVYTIIDMFTDYGNPLMKMIIDAAKQVAIGRSTAMVWTYFLIIAVVLAAVISLMRKMVFYVQE
jgi:ABC-type sugar transport system permease subunit